MSTHIERRVEKLAQRLKARCRADGTARPGFEQNVASIRSELEELSDRKGRMEFLEGNKDGE